MKKRIEKGVALEGARQLVFEVRTEQDKVDHAGVLPIGDERI